MPSVFGWRGFLLQGGFFLWVRFLDFSNRGLLGVVVLPDRNPAKFVVLPGIEPWILFGSGFVGVLERVSFGFWPIVGWFCLCGRSTGCWFPGGI